MFKFWLIILIFSDGGWAIDKTDGWHPRQQQNWKICVERKDFFNAHRNDGRKAMCRKVMG